MNDRRIEIGKALSDGWQAVMANPAPAIVGYLVFTLIVLVGNLIPIVNWLFTILVTPALTGGAMILILNVSNRDNPQIGDIFAGFNRYGQWMGAYWLLAVIGLLCWIPFGICLGIAAAIDEEAAFAILIPLGIIISLVIELVVILRWVLVYLLLADKTVTCRVMEAFRMSAEITKGHRWMLLLAGIVFALVGFAGFLACGVGVILTGPVTGCAFAAVYKQLKPGEPVAEVAVDAGTGGS